jgi:hypothetical protein
MNRQAGCDLMKIMEQALKRTLGKRQQPSKVVVIMKQVPSVYSAAASLPARNA